MEAEISSHRSRAKYSAVHDGASKSEDLHIIHYSRLTIFNRVFAVIYTFAILVLLYHHFRFIFFHSAAFSSFLISLSMLVADLILAFMWISRQSFRMYPIYREELVNNLEKEFEKSDFPLLDVFICTADPYKEPPMNVVNTALSVMAYDYPTEKISVYVSDDGGSAMTLFALVEAAKFARCWLPFCRKNDVVDRNPFAFFASNSNWTSDAELMKLMYESMKIKVENVLERGEVREEYRVQEERHRFGFHKWNHNNFTRQDHPTVIEVLLDKSNDKDVAGEVMPNFIYLSREKSSASFHQFKAGALNALLRVSTVMTNAPIILTLDCDTYSNDPQTLRRVLCYLLDRKINSNLAYVQFPQHFNGINRSDIYASDFKRLYQINPVGMDGLSGPYYFGSGTFFSRRAFFGSPSFFESPEHPDLSPYHVNEKPIQSEETLIMAHHVADCEYEKGTKWGSKLGFRYGTLSEDHLTGFLQKCEGWKSIFCNPEKPAFYGDNPINIVDALTQTKRWTMGLNMIGFSKYCPITYGPKHMGPLMVLAYAHNVFWPIWSIPITVYSFLPQLALFSGVPTFPKVFERLFFLYVFLVVGAYGQDLLDFINAGGTFKRWWNDQRMWMMRALSSFTLGSIEFILKSLNANSASVGFTVTNKVVDDEESKRYEQEVFQFGVESPLFVPFTTAAVVNFVAFVCGLVKIVIMRGSGSELEELFGQMVVAGFGAVNSWPVYQAMVLRSDKGRMPLKVSVLSVLLSCFLFSLAFVSLLELE